MRNRFPLLLLPLLLMLALPAAAEEVAEYMRAQALVNWTYIVPEKPLDQDNLTRSFQARVRRSGKLQSLGLPVRVGDLVQVKQQGPYIWEISTPKDSIKVNTYDIPAQYYPRFR